MAVDSVNFVPVSCIPSPESPVNRMATLSTCRTALAGTFSNIALILLDLASARSSGKPAQRVPNPLYLARPGVKPPTPFPFKRGSVRRSPKGLACLRPTLHRTESQGRRAPIRYEAMHFSARSAPARPAIELHSLRRSLNTPVLVIAELPVGPGSAVIAAHVDSCDGLARYTLAVRSERNREVVFFSMREEDLSPSESWLAAEAALSLAEGMGFLFEEDLPPISREAAASMWEEFVDSADPSAAAAAAAAAVRPTALLTKFRRPPSRSAAGSAAARPSEAGPQRATRGAKAGFEPSDTQIARQGDR
jgi:hypothetical protein